MKDIFIIIHFPFDAFAPNISLTLKAVCPRRMEEKEDPESKDTGSSSHFLLKVCVCRGVGVGVCVCRGEREQACVCMCV